MTRMVGAHGHHARMYITDGMYHKDGTGFLSILVRGQLREDIADPTPTAPWGTCCGGPAPGPGSGEATCASSSSRSATSPGRVRSTSTRVLECQKVSY